MKYKKGGFDLQSFIVVFLLFMGIMVTLGSVAFSLGNSYRPITNNTVDASFINTYNQLDDVEDETEELKDRVIDTDTGTTDSSIEFLGDAVNSLKVVGKSLKAVVVMIDDISRTMGIPPFLFRVFSSIVIIMLFTVIIFMIFRYR